MKLSRNRQNTEINGQTENTNAQPDLSRLSKKELLEILLRQGEEIDSLRSQVEELQASLDDKEFKLSRLGSLAEASLAVTDIFKEADEAARIYLTNIKRLAEENMKK